MGVVGSSWGQKPPPSSTNSLPQGRNFCHKKLSPFIKGSWSSRFIGIEGFIYSMSFRLSERSERTEKSFPHFLQPRSIAGLHYIGITSKRNKKRAFEKPNALFIKNLKCININIGRISDKYSFVGFGQLRQIKAQCHLSTIQKFIVHW